MFSALGKCHQPAVTQLDQETYVSPLVQTMPWHQGVIWNNVNSLRPRPNRRHFADDIFKYIFLNENVWISVTISLKFVPKGSINKIPALVQIMAWRRPGDKPLSEAMMIILLTHMYSVHTQTQTLEQKLSAPVVCFMVVLFREKMSWYDGLGIHIESIQ